MTFLWGVRLSFYMNVSDARGNGVVARDLGPYEPFLTDQHTCENAGG